MIGVIADDLTGAAELGAVGVRHGLLSQIVLAGGATSGDARLVCIDTDSRLCDPDEAARRAAAAAAMLADHGAALIYKKTDSVLRGNAGRETEAVVRQLGLAGALLVPANPSLGRTMAGGRSFIHGVPLDETDFRRDPGHPRVTADVLEMLDRPSLMLVTVGGPGDALHDGTIHLGEAATAADIRAWAGREKGGRLLAGGADFFRALMTAPEVAVVDPLPRTKQLFVCGSASESTRAFVASQAAAGIPVFAVAGDPADLAARVRAAFDRHPRVILHGGSSSAAYSPERLILLAAEVLRTTGVPHVFAEGGATAAALARAMDWRALRVKSEAAPGVVTLAADANRLFTIKPGSYAWPDPR